ncbi:MAG: YIP1 family protein [Firmicutes bacterium]|nr:YIP1 family protein [Bacillota bacterium]
MTRTEYVQSLRYSLYTMRRPLVGFWDLVHERKGSMAAAHTIVVLAVIVEILRYTATNFQFRLVNLESFNIFIVIAQVLLPLFLWTIANWSLTTLMDGKGRLKDIYMGTAYALVPMIIINAALVPVSHIITFDEGALYWLMTSVGMFWFVLLLLCAMMEIHDYTMSKTILSSLFTVVAIGVIIFVFVMFFAVVSDGVAYFISLGQEILFRMR